MIERCPVSCLAQRERHWIAAFDNLVNSNPGGGGRRAGFTISEEHRRRIAASNMGKPGTQTPALNYIDRTSVVDLYEMGVRVVDLVEIFDVQKSTIYNIIKAG